MGELGDCLGELGDLSTYVSVIMSVEAMEIDEPELGVRPVPVWAQPIMTYLVEDSLPGDEVSARQIDRKSVV